MDNNGWEGNGETSECTRLEAADVQKISSWRVWAPGLDQNTSSSRGLNVQKIQFMPCELGPKFMD
jgi:hypothetical protein